MISGEAWLNDWPRCCGRVLTFGCRGVVLLGVLSSIAMHGASGSKISPEAFEFFEKKIRPVLAAECYECHGAEKQKGGLRLDSRPGWEEGGNLGDAIVPGDPAKSLLLTAIKHADPDLAMPDKAPKLSDTVIADFETWIRMGAPDPRDQPSADPAERPSWDQLFAARKTWWSLQPVQKTTPPAVRNAAWSAHSVDRFLLARMEARNLAPVDDADPRTLIRRLTFTLIGLPPQPDDVAAFVTDHVRDPQQAIAAHTERLLASPRFGEHWSRRWMDLVRYAETHGSEGDPAIPEAWRYRDYLIRALNADVPIDQLVREQIAGDQLPNPRLSPEGVNESRIGPAQLRFGEHGFQPIDTLDDQVKTIDNQIDVVTKAFQGLTVSCARCHDHKFDAISQRDFTALYGIFASVRPAQIVVDAPPLLEKNRTALQRLHGKIRSVLADAWLAATESFAARLLAESDAFNPEDLVSAADGEAKVEPAGSSLMESGTPSSAVGAAKTSSPQWRAAFKDALSNRNNPLHLWAMIMAKRGERFTTAWQSVTAELNGELQMAEAVNREKSTPLWDLGGDDYERWFKNGLGLTGPVRTGEFAVAPSGERILDGIVPAGVLTNRLSGKHHALLTSPRFKIEHDYLSVRAAGSGAAAVRVIIDNYPLPRNNIFPTAVLERAEPGWVRLDTSYRKGSYAYVEFGTREDLTRPLEDKNKKLPAAGELSHFAVSEIVVHNEKNLPRTEAIALPLLLEEPSPATTAELAERYADVLAAAVVAWRENRLTEPQRVFLDAFVRRGLLPVTLDAVPAAQALVSDYRRLEREIPVPRRVPGVIESVGMDAPLYMRGDHLKPADAVPRGYLAAIDPGPYRTNLSGRLELAHAIASENNPLTARVMANRVWQWIFGEGIVRTVDNFGRLGDQPTHPELLDHLAGQMVARGWSLKEMVRLLVSTRAFRLSSTPSAAATENDPSNALLSHMRVRRLEAESIRDSLLAVSGELQDAMFGPSVASNVPRRSIYVQVRRTKLDPFLQTFDAPAPFSTLGRRTETNVPAQSLTLLNAPFVIERAAAWTRKLAREPALSTDGRVDEMFERALARRPNAHERSAIAEYLALLARNHELAPEDVANSERVWRDFAHAIFNLKEFIYVR